MCESLIAIRSVTLQYSNAAEPLLTSFNLDIKRGDYIFLVGPNGSGKSTLFNLILNRIRPSVGDVFRKKNLRIAYISQEMKNTLFLDLTVLENLKLMHIPITPTLNHYLKGFHQKFPSYLDQPTKLLSGGEKQALALAIKLYHAPDLLLLDEHTSALDPKAAHALMRLTDEKIKNNKITTILCTHSLNLLKRYGGRVIEIDQGKISFDGNVDAFIKKSHPDQLSEFRL